MRMKYCLYNSNYFLSLSVFISHWSSINWTTSIMGMFLLMLYNCCMRYMYVIA